jgi:hypothetical protein
MKAKYTFLLIFLWIQVGFSQEENNGIKKFLLKLEINGLAPISAILEYELNNVKEDTGQSSLTFHTIKMKKKFLKKGFKKSKKINSPIELNLSNDLQKTLLKKSLLTLCQNEEDMSGMNSDGIYFQLQIERVDNNGEQKCLVLLDRGIISKKDNELGDILNRILDQIQYSKLEEEFKESLKRGYYYNNGNHLWKKR